MDKQAINFKDHEEILKDLDNLEDKLQLINDFLSELEKVRQMRKDLIENLVLEKGREKSLLNRTSQMKRVTFDYSLQGVTPRKESIFERKKSIIDIYGLLESLSINHREMERKIRELQFLRSQNISDRIKNIELDKGIAKLQADKNEITNQITQIVVKNFVDTKTDFVAVITNLEDENHALQDKINVIERNNVYLKDTIRALMRENQLIMKGDRRLSDAFRNSILERTVSLVLPESLRPEKQDLSEDDHRNRRESDFSAEVPRPTQDSFDLDAALATWSTDQQSMYEQVSRIRRDLEAMEVNQMKLNLLKLYVEKHGTKYIQWEDPNTIFNHIPL